MNDCPNGELRDLLPDLLHGRLTPALRREVEAHVAACEDCRAELALLGAMRATLRRAPAVDTAAIAAAIPPYRAPARRSWGGWRAAAAILVLAAGGTSVAVLQSRDGAAGAGRETAVAVAAAPVPVVDSAAPAAQPDTPAVAAPRELAVASAAVTDLDDSELSTLLADLQTLDAVPSADVENAGPVSPLLPTGTN